MSDSMRLLYILRSSTILFFCGTAALLTPVEAQDIFSTPAPATSAQRLPYPTSASLMEGVKSGEIPEFCLDDGEFASHMDALGRSIVAILHNEYGVNIEGGAHEAPPSIDLALLMQNITKYELDDHDAHMAGAFQNNHKLLVARYPKTAEAFDKLARDYSTAVKEYIVLKKQRDDGQQAAVAERQHQSDVAVKQMQDKADQDKAVADAQIASQKAQDDIKEEAAKDARVAQTKEREGKLQSILESPAYKQWTAALRVEQGEKMVKDAQSVLDHDDAVQKESGVSDLAARRGAGENIVAGKELVKKAFIDYIKLDGTATSPDDVQAGPDPAAEYR